MNTCRHGVEINSRCEYCPNYRAIPAPGTPRSRSITPLQSFTCRGCGRETREPTTDHFGREICRDCLALTQGVVSSESGAYKTVELLPQYIDEHLTASDGTPIIYLSPEQRRQYRIHVRKGVVLNRFYLPILNTRTTRETIFVMDPNGHLYLCKDPQPGFHHSSFLAGGRVAGAGDLRLKWARLAYIGKRSGHYRPDDSIAEQVVERLRVKGVTFRQDAEGRWTPEIGWRRARMTLD